MPDTNIRHENATADGIQLAQSMYGERVTDTMTQDNTGEGIVNAGTMWSTAPYKKPQPKRRENDRGHALCSSPDCKAYPITDQVYCVGHARSLGLIENWNKEGKSGSD